MALKGWSRADRPIRWWLLAPLMRAPREPRHAGRRRDAGRPSFVVPRQGVHESDRALVGAGNPDRVRPILPGDAEWPPAIPRLEAPPTPQARLEGWLRLTDRKSPEVAKSPEAAKN